MCVRVHACIHSLCVEVLYEWSVAGCCHLIDRLIFSLSSFHLSSIFQSFKNLSNPFLLLLSHHCCFNPPPSPSPHTRPAAGFFASSLFPSTTYCSILREKSVSLVVSHIRETLSPTLTITPSSSSPQSAPPPPPSCSSGTAEKAVFAPVQNKESRTNLVQEQTGAPQRSHCDWAVP